MRNLIFLVTLILVGCGQQSQTEFPPQISHESKFLMPLETLSKQLRNPDFRWEGPTSVEDRIPTLDAACALAYRGDSAAMVLFDAVDDQEVEVYSVLDAISELGIPTRFFHDEIMARDSAGLRKWWKANRVSSMKERNKHRYQIGLPPAEIAGDANVR